MRSPRGASPWRTPWASPLPWVLLSLRRGQWAVLPLAAVALSEGIGSHSAIELPGVAAMLTGVHLAAAGLWREDVQAGLVRSETSQVCPYKGTPWYSSTRTQTDIAWSYEEPLDDAACVAGHVSFADSASVEVS